MLERTENEIQDAISAAMEAELEGSKWPGMSYEAGVSAALRWVIGETEDHPMEEQ